MESFDLVNLNLNYLSHLNFEAVKTHNPLWVDQNDFATVEAHSVVRPFSWVFVIIHFESAVWVWLQFQHVVKQILSVSFQQFVVQIFVFFHWLCMRDTVVFKCIGYCEGFKHLWYHVMRAFVDWGYIKFNVLVDYSVRVRWVNHIDPGLLMLLYWV